MNKWMLASLSLLLAGAAALPAQAQDQIPGDPEPSAEPGQVGSSDSDRGSQGDGSGEGRFEAGVEGRVEGRGEGRQERDEGRREAAREERSERREWQADGRPGEPGQIGPAPVLRQPEQGRGYDRRGEPGQPGPAPVVFQPEQGFGYDRRGEPGQPGPAPVVLQPEQRFGHDRRGEPGQPGLAPVVRHAEQGRGHDRRYDRRDGRRAWNADRRDLSHYNDHYDNRFDSRFDSRFDNRFDNRYDGRRYDLSRYLRHHDRRWNGNQWYPQYRYRAPVRYVYPRGFRAYQWRVGHRLPSNYYGSNYYVDYNAYRLPQPPYGYHWVRVDRDVVLVAMASGLIRDILRGIYY